MHLIPGEKTNCIYCSLRIFPFGISSHPAEIKVLYESNLNCTGQELEEGKHKMWLYGEVAVRGLHEVVLADPPHLSSHTLRVSQIANMFDDRI